jgi:hypothetical protein
MVRSLFAMAASQLEMARNLSVSGWPSYRFAMVESLFAMAVSLFGMAESLFATAESLFGTAGE